ncbi:hypothetical protein [Spongiimicrobium salis]|uniref:hypothetical protein n=1 Tax=Spongiimicrobium salis TaxID=1667022 RepID=UPI00374DAE0E
MEKLAIVLLSDPKAGSEESLGRLFNTLTTAYEYKKAGKEVKIIFQGTGTRWPEALKEESHPGHQLFNEVKDTVAGVSEACAKVWGADPSGFDLLGDNKVPNIPGVPSFLNLHDQGFTILVF